MNKAVALIGYSGHAFVAADILLAMGKQLAGYFDQTKKEINPYKIPYLGDEQIDSSGLKHLDYFIAIGDNKIRNSLFLHLEGDFGCPINIVHPTAWISPHADIAEGVMVSAHASINALARIGMGVICNTSSVIEHDCLIDDFAHIAPGAVLGGNVHVGKGSLIGAGAVIKPGIRIGEHVTIGAGAVVVKSVPRETVVIGNPQRFL